jgi:hypothetical protein
VSNFFQGNIILQIASKRKESDEERDEERDEVKESARKSER